MRNSLIALVGLLLACNGVSSPGVTSPKPGPENTLWRLCYDPEGWPEIAENAKDAKELSCKRPTVIRWGSLPIKVHLDPSVTAGADAFLFAFAAWESWMGVPVFELVPHSGADVVEAFLDTEPSVGAAAMAPHRKMDDGKLRFVIIFWDLYFMDAEVIAHELGHVLGLAHDRDNRRSIMWPDVRTKIPELSGADRQALCSLYGC